MKYKPHYMITGQLKSDIDKLWETFWTGGLSNPLLVIEQITYLLFIKRMDELQLAKEAKANMIGGDIEDPIYSEEERVLRWNVFKNFEAKKIYELFTIPQKLFPEEDEEDMGTPTVFSKMKDMGTAGNAFQNFMEGATFIIPTARLLESAVSQLDKIDDIDQDTKGDLYEYLLSKIATAGQNGQFRTPRHIIRMMVDMMKPTPDDVICDPSAGTMGFLVASIDYLREHHEKSFFDEEKQHHFETEMFNGIEMDPSMIRIGAMNMMLHGIENPKLEQNDSLSEAAGHIKEKYSLILANPPFKGSLDYDAVDDSILSVVKSKKTELLFLAMMLRSLKVGGRAAVVVPDGVLFGNSKAHKTIRKEILERHQLQAIISMPSGVFKPYAGVSTAIMIFTKTESGGTDDVWFYDMAADGYSLDDKRNEIKENDIADILTRWSNLSAEKKRARTDKSFLVPLKEIQDNDWDLSINRYKEIVYEEIEYDSPSQIITNIEDLDLLRKAALDKLKANISLGVI